MNKKTTGIIAYITWIGWIVAFCAGDKEGAKFHLNQALVILIGQIVAAVINYIPYVGGIVGTILSIFLFVCWIMGLIYACQEQEKESSSDRPDQDFKIIKMTISHKKNPRCSLHRGFFLWVRLAAHVSVIIKKL